MIATRLPPPALKPPVARLPRARLLPAVERLDPADYALLHVSFGHGLRDEQLAQIVGVETRAVARMRAAALGRLADGLAITTGVGLAELLGTLLELPPEQWAVDTGETEGEGATAAVLQRLAAARPVAPSAPTSIRAAVAAAAAIIAILLLTLGGGGQDSPLRDGAPERAGVGTATPSLLDTLADAVRRNRGDAGAGAGEGGRSGGEGGGRAADGGRAAIALASSAPVGASGDGPSGTGVADGPARQGRDGAGDAPAEGSPREPGSGDGDGGGSQGPGGPESPPAAGPPGRAKEDQDVAAPPASPPRTPPPTVAPPSSGSPPARGDTKGDVPAAPERDCEEDGGERGHDSGDDSDDG